MVKENDVITLESHDTALGNYFDGLLLTDVDAAAPVPPPTPKEVVEVVEVVEVIAVVEEPPPVSIEDAQAPPTAALPSAELEARVVCDQPHALDTTQPYPWAATTFKCLLFVVNGLKLAIPLATLSGYTKLSDGVRDFSGAQGYLLGDMMYKGQCAKIINLAKLVMPDIYQVKGKQNVLKQYRHVLFVKKAQWALACDKVLELVTMRREQVRWRTGDCKRAWLAGTATGQTCAVLDVDAVITIAVSV